MNFGRKIIAWYDRSLRLWTAVYQNSDCNQIGVAGYGSSKQEAISDLAYQNPGA
jgi:hypothetical protein